MFEKSRAAKLALLSWKHSTMFQRQNHVSEFFGNIFQQKKRPKYFQFEQVIEL